MSVKIKIGDVEVVVICVGRYMLASPDLLAERCSELVGEYALGYCRSQRPVKTDINDLLGEYVCGGSEL